MEKRRTIDYRLPLHIQLKEMIRTKIQEEEYKLGEQIPSEREMAMIYGLNRMTVKNAINGLVEEGYLKRVQGSGTYVIKTGIMRDLETLTGLSATIKDKGMNPSSKVIVNQVIIGYPEMNKQLQLDENAKIFRLLRLRLGDGQPIALEDTYVPYDLFPEIDQQNFEILSLMDFMQQNGVTVIESQQYLTIEKVNERESKYLNVAPDTPVFAFTYISRDESDRIVEYTKSYTLGDNTKFEVKLR